VLPETETVHPVIAGAITPLNPESTVMTTFVILSAAGVNAVLLTVKVKD
jgi:hypothetical protein